MCIRDSRAHQAVKLLGHLQVFAAAFPFGVNRSIHQDAAVHMAGSHCPVPGGDDIKIDIVLQFGPAALLRLVDILAEHIKGGPAAPKKGN